MINKCLLVTHDAVNNSPTKAKYSFSKEKRFSSISGTFHTPSEFTHDLPHTLGRRSPSFGIGERFKVRIQKSKLNIGQLSLSTICLIRRHM